MRLVLRAGRRALWRHPLQLLLAVTGVAVGVAVVVAVDLANASASEAMRLAVERVAGRATHQIAGGPQGLPEDLYRHLRVDLGIDRVAPVVEGGVTVGRPEGKPLTLLGLDPFAEGPFRGYLRAGGDRDGPRGDATELLLHDDRIALPSQEMSALGVAPGDALTLWTPVGERTVTVGPGIDSQQRDLRGLAFADIAAAQALLGRTGRLDRIDLILDADQERLVEAALPEGAALLPAAARGNALAQMSDAFHLNLAALSLLALVVGLFLVFNTMSFLVVQRRAMIGTLRAVGVTRRQALAQVLTDAGLIGILGTAVGLPLGVALATGLTDLVLRSVNDLYFQTVGGMTLQPWSLAKGLALGLAGTVLAGLPPAREAAGVSPRVAMSRGELESRARRGAVLMALAGTAVLVAGGLAISLFSGLVAGFAGLFAVIIGSALLVPLGIVHLGRIVGRLGPSRLVWRLAINGAVASLSRTGVAVAALAVAVSAVIGVAVMIDSFRGSVVQWLQQSLRADYYVSAAAPMEPAVADRLSRIDGVNFLTRSRWYRQPTDDGFVQIWSLGLPRDAWAGFDIRVGDPAEAWTAFTQREGVLISEPYAYDRDLTVGDRVTLRTDEGQRAFTVAGVFRDYGTVQGVVVMARTTFLRWWGDDRLSGIGVYATAPADRDDLVQRLQDALAGVPGARVRDNRGIYEGSLKVFDQTFVITSVLRLLAAAVAFVGVLGALMALQLDRAREYATLRALGLTRQQLGGLVAAQSGLLGFASGLFAIPLGLILAWLLVFVINRRAFGWTMDFVVGAGPLVEGVLLAVVAATLAAVYPAWRTARRLPAAGLREE